VRCVDLFKDHARAGFLRPSYMHRIDTQDGPSWLTVELGFRINETTMLPLLSIAICVFPLLLPRYAFSRPRQERGA
jgi:hypothetical protein